jgi:hypothetical protein
VAKALKSIGTEVEMIGADVTQRTETNEHRDFREFLVPTAQELERLILRGAISSHTNEQDNCFANLLNQGSSLE